MMSDDFCCIKFKKNSPPKLFDIDPQKHDISCYLPILEGYRVPILQLDPSWKGIQHKLNCLVGTWTHHQHPNRTNWFWCLLLGFRHEFSLRYGGQIFQHKILQMGKMVVPVKKIITKLSIKICIQKSPHAKVSAQSYVLLPIWYWGP